MTEVYIVFEDHTFCEMGYVDVVGVFKDKDKARKMADADPVNRYVETHEVQ